MNTVNLIGRLTADPQMRYFESGKAIAKFSIAVNRTKEETDFFEMEAWEKTAEVIGQYGKKGSQVGVSGSLLQERWVDRATGGNRSKVVVRCNRVDLLGSKQDEQVPSNTVAPTTSQAPSQAKRQVKPPVAAQAGAGADISGDDIPF